MCQSSDVPAREDARRGPWRWGSLGAIEAGGKPPPTPIEEHRPTLKITDLGKARQLIKDFGAEWKTAYYQKQAWENAQKEGAEASGNTIVGKTKK